MMAFRPMSEPGSAFSDIDETIFLHWSHHLDSVTSLNTVVFCAGGRMSSTIRPLCALPFLALRSLPQPGHDARGMKCVWSGVRPDFPRLPQPVLLLRFFFLFVFFCWFFVVGFGLPSLSHSGFFDARPFPCRSRLVVWPVVRSARLFAGLFLQAGCACPRVVRGSLQ